MGKVITLFGQEDYSQMSIPRGSWVVFAKAVCDDYGNPLRLIFKQLLSTLNLEAEQIESMKDYQRKYQTAALMDKCMKRFDPDGSKGMVVRMLPIKWEDRENSNLEMTLQAEVLELRKLNIDNITVE